MNAAQYLLVCVWSMGDMRLAWAFGVKNRQAAIVLPCLQSAFETPDPYGWLATAYLTVTLSQG